MERYCARECKLGMHGSSEYSRRVNTRTLPGARVGGGGRGIDTRNDTSCVRQEGVEAATGNKFVVPSTIGPRSATNVLYGDGGQ